MTGLERLAGSWRAFLLIRRLSGSDRVGLIAQLEFLDLAGGGAR